MQIKSTLACAALVPLLCAASEPVRLQPSSKWVLDYAEDSCRLIRTFGEGKDKTTLVFESIAPGDLTMLAIGQPLSARATNNKVPTRLVPVQQDTFDGTAAMSAVSNKPAVVWTHVPLVDIIDGREIIPVAARQVEASAKPGVRPPGFDVATRAAIKAERLEFVSRITAIELEPRRRHAVILEVGSMGEPIKMFDQCGRDQLRGWGIDPDVDEKIVRRVWTAKPQQWLYANDYPRQMLMADKESQVVARLLVGADGRVTKCTALSHVDAPQFQETVCNALKSRAQFEPAELADGTKVPSYTIYRVTFQIR